MGPWSFVGWLLVAVGDWFQVFVNYPEPPEAHDEDRVGGHLLDAAFFTSVHDVLTADGTVTVVRGAPTHPCFQLLL